MVTTRSRGNKQAAGLDTAQDMNTSASAIPTSTDKNTSPLKRKSGTAPTDTSPVTKIAKTDLGPELDMNTEPAMPPAPAPTPVTPANTTKQQQQSQLPPHQQLPAAANVSQPTLDDIIAAAAVGTGFTPNTALATPTAPPAPAPAAEASLETLKEPEPESAPLPDLSTVLTQPAEAQQHQPIVPPAPTAPALSTIAAPAPVSANTTTTATATGPGVQPAIPVLATTEDPTVHGGATTAHNNINHSNGVVPLDAFAINPITNAVPPGDLTPIPSASPLPAVSHQQQNLSPNTNNRLKGEAALASNIDINTADNGGGMAPTAPVVAPAGSVEEQQATEDHHQAAEANDGGDKSTVVNVQPLSSVI
ncbi:hypothetical protein BGW39_009703 [Mortierella sp. 14UC]|nr:hypothetical protein BGW39_009703 [Mortierella sp. 14UC]